jgi:hypothetical protein
MASPMQVSSWGLIASTEHTHERVSLVYDSTNVRLSFLQTNDTFTGKLFSLWGWQTRTKAA